MIDFFRNKKWDRIKKLIKSNQIDWTLIVDSNNPPLHFLTYANKLDLISKIDQTVLYAILELTNVDGDNPYHIASRLKLKDILLYFISINPDAIYNPNDLGISPLYYLLNEQIILGDLIGELDLKDHKLYQDLTLVEYLVMEDMVQPLELILNHIKLESIPTDIIATIASSPLELKVKEYIIMKLLIEGSDINGISEPTYLSALNVALYEKDYELVKFLLKNGANINYSGPENIDNPLAISFLSKDPNLINLVWSYKPDLSLRDKNFNTVVHKAFFDTDITKNIPLDIKKAMIRKVDVNKVNKNLDSILFLLILNDDWKSYYDILKTKSLDIHLMNKDGKKVKDLIDPEDLNKFAKMVYLSHTKNTGDKIDPKLMDQIMNTSSQPNNLLRSDLNLIQTQTANTTMFKGNIHNYLLLLYISLKKFPQLKIPYLPCDESQRLHDLYEDIAENICCDSRSVLKSFKHYIKSYMNYSPTLIHHLIIWREWKCLFVSPYLINAINYVKRSDPKFRFFNLKLSLIGDEINHSNILIIDIKKKLIERFDPYGNVVFMNTGKLDEFLKKFFSVHLSDYKYMGPSEAIKGISIQVYSDELNPHNKADGDPDGFCVAWCLWYLEMKLRNPDKTQLEIIEGAIDQINKGEIFFKDYIRNYAEHLENEKNKLLDIIGFPTKFRYMDYVPEEHTKSLFKSIRELYCQINI